MTDATEEPTFLIIQYGDGEGQHLVAGHEAAARTAFGCLVCGEPEDDDTNDADRAIYEAIRNPESEEWQEAGPSSVLNWSFEDGALEVIRLSNALLPSDRVRELEEENARLKGVALQIEKLADGMDESAARFHAKSQPWVDDHVRTGHLLNGFATAVRQTLSSAALSQGEG